MYTIVVKILLDLFSTEQSKDLCDSMSTKPVGCGKQCSSEWSCGLEGVWSCLEKGICV